MSARVINLARQVRDELADAARALTSLDIDGLLVPRELVATLKRARNVVGLAHPRSIALVDAATADEGGEHMRKLVDWLLQDEHRAVKLQREPGSQWSCTLRGPFGTEPREVLSAFCPGLGNAVETALDVWTARDAPRDERPWPWAD